MPRSLAFRINTLYDRLTIPVYGLVEELDNACLFDVAARACVVDVDSPDQARDEREDDHDADHGTDTPCHFRKHRSKRTASGPYNHRV